MRALEGQLKASGGGDLGCVTMLVRGGGCRGLPIGSPLQRADPKNRRMPSERKRTVDLLRELSHDELLRHLEEALELAGGQEATIRELEEENLQLRGDVDTVLELLEEEKRVNEELNKMIQSSNKSNASLERQNGKLKAKLKNKGFDLVEVEEQDRLRREVEALSASQAHLIDSLDASADELDKVSRENAALMEAVARLRASCVAYENQVQEHIKVESRLKDFLEEGAQYIDGKVSVVRETVGAGRGSVDAPLGSPVGTSNSGREAQPAGGGPEADEHRVEMARAKAHVSALEDSVTLWQARCGSLEVQVMALCAELNRLSTCAGGMQSFVVSALADLEGRCA